MATVFRMVPNSVSMTHTTCYTPLHVYLPKFILLSNPDHALWLFHSPCYSLLFQSPHIPQPHSVIIVINLQQMLISSEIANMPQRNPQETDI